MSSRRAFLLVAISTAAPVKLSAQESSRWYWSVAYGGGLSYPSKALGEGIEGVVEFEVLIEKDRHGTGRVKQMVTESGHPLLLECREGLRGLQYLRSRRRGGKTLRLRVEFCIDRTAVGGMATYRQTGGAVRIVAAAPARLLSAEGIDEKPSPIVNARSLELAYPPLARQARIQGPVEFDLAVESGRVVHIVEETGHPVLLSIRDRIKEVRLDPSFSGRARIELKFELTEKFIRGYTVHLDRMRFTLLGAPPPLIAD